MSTSFKCFIYTNVTQVPTHSTICDNATSPDQRSTSSLEMRAGHWAQFWG